MSTTTIRLSQELRERVDHAAKRAGVSAHSFMLEAIAEKVAQVEDRRDFHRTAEARYERIAKSGKTLPWAVVRQHLERHVAGKKSARPKARKLAG